MPPSELDTVVDHEKRINEIAPRYPGLIGDLPPDSRVALDRLEHEEKRREEKRRKREQRQAERRKQHAKEELQRAEERRLDQQRKWELDQREIALQQREWADLARHQQEEQWRQQTYRTTHPLAIAALISCFFLTPVVGGVLGVVALGQINAQPNLYKGRGCAAAAVVLGVLTVVFVVLYFLMFLGLVLGI